jgi:hypothetical protein
VELLPGLGCSMHEASHYLRPSTLARSLDCEHDGALPEALAALTDAFGGDAEELAEVGDLPADAARLATETGDRVPLTAGFAQPAARTPTVDSRLVSGTAAIRPRPLPVALARSR